MSACGRESSYCHSASSTRSTQFEGNHSQSSSSPSSAVSTRSSTPEKVIRRPKRVEQRGGHLPVRLSASPPALSSDTSSVHGIFKEIYADQERRLRQIRPASGPVKPASSLTLYRRLHTALRTSEPSAVTSSVASRSSSSAHEEEQITCAGEEGVHADVDVTLPPPAQCERTEIGEHTEYVDGNISTISRISSILARNEHATEQSVGMDSNERTAMMESSSSLFLASLSPPPPPPFPVTTSVKLEFTPLKAGVEKDTVRQKQGQSSAASMEQERMNECTFRPAISPFSEYLAAYHNSSRRGSGVNSARESSVYDRLYRSEKRPLINYSKTEVCPERGGDEPRILKLGRRGHERLREHCGGFSWKAKSKEDAFDLFLSNVLGTDCRNVPFDELVKRGCSIDTSWVSPLYHNIGGANCADASKDRSPSPQNPSVVQLSSAQDHHSPKISPPSGTGAVGISASERSRSFKDFLDRQQLYAKRRTSKIRQVQESTAPTFHPETTARSAQLRDKMVENSLRLATSSSAEETNSDSQTVEEVAAAVFAHQYQHIPFSTTTLGHRSTPLCSASADASCPFRPTVSPAAQRLPSDPRRYESLYEEHRSRDKKLREAQASAEAQQIAGLTFEPRVNKTRNNECSEDSSKTKSASRSSSSIARFEEFQRRKEERQRIQRETSEREREVCEMAECTFHPKITKAPDYISRIAKDYVAMDKVLLQSASGVKSAR